MYLRFLYRHVSSYLRSSVLRVTIPNQSLYFIPEVAATRSAPKLTRFSSTESANDFVVDELQEDDAPGKLFL